MFGFPKADRPPTGQFKRNLLKSVTFQLKFERSDDVVAGFKVKRETLKNKFPITNPISQNFAEVRFEKDKTPIIQKASSSNLGYEFKTENNNKTLVITEDTFSYTIDGPTYQNFLSAISEMKDTFFPILEECNVLSFNRIAIRKINLIEPVDPPYVNKDLLFAVFHDQLVKSFTYFPNIEEVVSGVTNVTMENADRRLNISYGLISPLQKNDKPRVLLDIDLFLVSQELGLKAIESIWEEINNEIFNIFNWAISADLKVSLSE